MRDTSFQKAGLGQAAIPCDLKVAIRHFPLTCYLLSKNISNRHLYSAVDNAETTSNGEMDCDEVTCTCVILCDQTQAQAVNNNCLKIPIFFFLQCNFCNLFNFNHQPLRNLLWFKVQVQVDLNLEPQPWQPAGTLRGELFISFTEKLVFSHPTLEC